MSLWITSSLRRRLALKEDAPGSVGKIDLSSFAAAYALAEQLQRDAASDELPSEPPAVDGPALFAFDALEELVERRLERVLAARGLALLERGARRLVEHWGERRASVFVRRLLDELDLSGVMEEAEEAGSLDATGCVRELLVLTVLSRHAGARRVLSRIGLSGAADTELGEALDLLSELLREEPSLSGEPTDLLRDLAGPLEAGGEDFGDVLRRLAELWEEVEGATRRRVEAALGLLAEAGAPRNGPGSAPDAGIGLDEGPAAYSEDSPWMRDLVLQVKHTLVWLEQLSRAYERPIQRLDEIPQDELERLAERGVSGLWLIGVWERSPASARIKRSQGQTDAAPSAYAVRRYRVAAELGGEDALEVLSRRARRCGIRLAADVVPNHLAIDSDWVVEHPERFLSLAEPPFPSYSFSGEDLSSETDVGIYLEDHYADRSDAAVVFRRVDRTSGEERYLYHGNDGTSTPWNDTAQLDYLNPDTREAMIETVLAVAARFPILRFDAAMTLTRQHLHRLWYPAPGAAGAIPSRAEHSLSSEEMERRLPHEFWRELVDRVQTEAPDTLLVAEAFWLMEGYFVRRLGMNRVYNSAFMHMLRDGQTGALRRLLVDTVAVDRELLARFANYLTNPDEESAAGQFGRGDRYFGACKVLATLPGLPMLGHGQWEGLDEKYGMEYRGPRRDERANSELVARHDREIAPLLRRRRLFCGVEEFLLLELEDARGTAEAVLAYANGRGRDLVVVAFNNSAVPASGRLAPVGGGAELIERLRDAVASRGAAAPHTTDWYLPELVTDRRVGWDPGAGAPTLTLEPFACVVLGAPATRTLDDQSSPVADDTASTARE